MIWYIKWFQQYYVLFVDCPDEKPADILQPDSSDVQVYKESGHKADSVNRPFACDICGVRYARPKMLEKHKCRHGSRRDAAQSSKAVIDHSQVNGSVGGFQAGSVDETVERVKKETRVRDGEGFVCGECGERFDEESSVKLHMFTKHMSTYNVFSFYADYVDYVLLQ